MRICKNILCLFTALVMLTTCAKAPQNDALREGYQECLASEKTIGAIERCTQNKFWLANSLAADNPYYAPLMQYFKKRSEIAAQADIGKITFDQYESRITFAEAEFNQAVGQIQTTNGQQVAGAVLAVALLTALVFVAAKGGAGGGYNGSSGSHQGCCSWHGGESGACYAGRLVCNDGKLSPTCGC